MPPKADLGDLRGLASGLDGRVSAMINGGNFDGAKAYKDSKVTRAFLGPRRCAAEQCPCVCCSQGPSCTVMSDSQRDT